jgi:hypothetical protein
MSINMSNLVGTLELRYLSKGRSEFGNKDIILKLNCNEVRESDMHFFEELLN